MKQWVRRLGYAAELMKPVDLVSVAMRHSQIHFLLSTSYYGNVLEVSPKLRHQFVIGHLVRSFSVRARLSAVIHHYQAIRRLISQAGFAAILSGGAELWSHIVDGRRFRVLLKHNKDFLYEGDILLTFCRKDVMLFQISFAIVPGALLGMAEQDVMLLGGAQGVRPEHEEMKPAIQANGGVAPSHIAMAALRGVAQALGIRAIAAVGNDDQITRTMDEGCDFSFNYDNFWPMFGGERNSRGFFTVPIEPREKPLEAIPRSHRRRSRKKREFKAEVTAQVASGLMPYRRPLEVPVMEEVRSRLKVAAITAPALLVAADAPLLF